MRTSFLGFALALILLSPAFSQTQETTPPPDHKVQEKVTQQDKIPTFRKNVTVVNVQFNVPPPVLLICRFCEDGSEPDCTAVKLNRAGEKEITAGLGGAVTV